MISRRGLFKMLGAVAASPALKPLAKLFPQTYHTYLVGKEAIFFDPEFVKAVKRDTSPFLARLRDVPYPVFHGGQTIKFYTYNVSDKELRKLNE